MLKYGKVLQFNPDRLDSHNIDRQSMENIPLGARVLEIGCATGFMGSYLMKEKKCEVIGVELGIEEAKVAKKVLRKVIVGNVEDQQVIRQIAKTGAYDVVFASALIEHLKNPWSALLTWKKFLNRDGRLIITTSNIAHWSMRMKIIRGDFEYQQYGILDDTHLRFFTTKTFPKLATDSGYQVDTFFIDSVGGGYPKISLLGSKVFPNLFAYQMGIVASKKS